MKSLLIIDGSQIVARLFAKIFRTNGWKIGACLDAESAMNLLVSVEHYDVVLLGPSMSPANGVHLVRFIRALEHRKTTAVVMVTSSWELTEEAIAAGADEVLPRPIDWYALVSAVDKHIS